MLDRADLSADDRMDRATPMVLLSICKQLKRLRLIGLGSTLLHSQQTLYSGRLALTLFVTWIRANHVDDTSTADDLTVFANALYAGSDFHG